jgi:hypothetical protein
MRDCTVINAKWLPELVPAFFSSSSAGGTSLSTQHHTAHYADTAAAVTH